jgi:hypothetical protein
MALSTEANVGEMVREFVRDRRGFLDAPHTESL